MLMLQMMSMIPALMQTTKLLVASVMAILSVDCLGIAIAIEVVGAADVRQCHALAA